MSLKMRWHRFDVQVRDIDMIETRRAMQTAPIQFELKHIFLLTLFIGFAITFGRLAGPLLLVLFVGLGVVAVSVHLLKVENLIIAGICGALLSIVVLSVIFTAFFNADVMVRFACLVAYPIFGYSVGIIDAASRAIRTGM